MEKRLARALGREELFLLPEAIRGHASIVAIPHSCRRLNADDCRCQQVRHPCSELKGLSVAMTVWLTEAHPSHLASLYFSGRNRLFRQRRKVGLHDQHLMGASRES